MRNEKDQRDFQLPWSSELHCLTLCMSDATAQQQVRRRMWWSTGDTRVFAAAVAILHPSISSRTQQPWRSAETEVPFISPMVSCVQELGGLERRQTWRLAQQPLASKRFVGCRRAESVLEKIALALEVRKPQDSQGICAGLDTDELGKSTT